MLISPLQLNLLYILFSDSLLTNVNKSLFNYMQETLQQQKNTINNLPADANEIISSDLFFNIHHPRMLMNLTNFLAL